ncbi:hypothetical protein [Roseibium sediminis]|uniref:VHL beta domain-containing protein n=1 Tax=Roseibium sediminis TaxID=1775174 RepID=UPI00123CA35C|nr:hypothetical protein [Roseibium sediminis]
MSGNKGVATSAWRLLMVAPLTLAALSPATPSLAQTPPETIRINVLPASPSIRSVLIDKKYRPIINRDKDGVIIDTLGSSGTTPPCDVKLEVTLENSRVLHRDAHLCSGDTLVVDVELDGKPGQARVIQGTGGTVPSTKAPATQKTQTVTSTPTTPSKSTEAQQKSGLEAVSPSTDSPLKPLEPVNTPIDAPATTTTAALDPQAAQPAGVISGFLGTTPSDARTWKVETGSAPGAPSTLVHEGGGANDADFLARCDTQSGVATITLRRTSAAISAGLSHPVRIGTDTFSATHYAIGSSANNFQNASFPEVELPMTDPLWQGLIKDSVVNVAVDGLPPYSISLKGSASPVRLFVAACSEAQVIVGEEQNGVGGADGSTLSDRSCSEVGRVVSAQADRPGQIIFRNSSNSAIEVHWVDYYGGERPYARLEPGQILEQQTYVSHAWIVRGAGGQCRGIYVSNTPYREVVIQDGGGASTNNDWIATGNPLPPADVGPQGGQTFSAARTVADYLCTAGVDLNVVYADDGSSATIAEMGYGVVTLRNLGAAGGFNYSGDGHSLKGQVNNLTWSRPGLREVFCARR